MSRFLAIFLPKIRLHSSKPQTNQVGAIIDPVIMTYADKTLTFTGDLADYDYGAILRDK